MRVGLQSWGTEGDLRPFLALGQALQMRGLEVELVFTGVEGKDFTALARDAGVETRFVDGGYFVTQREALAQKTRESLRLGGPRAQFERILRDLMDPVAEQMLEAARDLAACSDAVVGHFLAHPAAAAAAEHARPFFLLALQPVFASAFYPPSGVPSLGPWLNPLTWRLAESVMDTALRGRLNASRAACGLPGLGRFVPANMGDPRQVLVAVSPALFPRPPDWAPHLDVTGFLELAAPATGHEALSPELETFLAEGEPVFLSFGSMFGLDDAQTLEALHVFAAALDRAGARGVVQAPARLLARAPKRKDVLYIERAPHAQLFLRCAAIVHHGGAGTTQSALLAGRGSIVVPHAADQFYWGDLLHARGVGARPLKRPALAARPLAARIRAVLDDAPMRARAEALSVALRREQGANRAA